MDSANDSIQETFRKIIESGRIDPLIGSALMHIKRAMGLLVMNVGSFNWSGVSFMNAEFAPGAFV